MMKPPRHPVAMATAADDQLGGGGDRGACRRRPGSAVRWSICSSPLVSAYGRRDREAARGPARRSPAAPPAGSRSAERPGGRCKVGERRRRRAAPADAGGHGQAEVGGRSAAGRGEVPERFEADAGERARRRRSRRGIRPRPAGAPRSTRGPGGAGSRARTRRSRAGAANSTVNPAAMPVMATIRRSSRPMPRAHAAATTPSVPVVVTSGASGPSGPPAPTQSSEIGIERAEAADVVAAALDVDVVDEQLDVAGRPEPADRARSPPARPGRGPPRAVPVPRPGAEQPSDAPRAQRGTRPRRRRRRARPPRSAGRGGVAEVGGSGAMANRSYYDLSVPHRKRGRGGSVLDRWVKGTHAAPSTTHHKGNGTMADYQLFIDGEYVDAQSGETFPPSTPSTGEKIADVAKAGREDAVRAIEAARKAFDDGPWPKMSGKERAEKLRKVAEIIDGQGREVAEIEARDGGGTIKKAMFADVPGAVAAFHSFAELRGERARRSSSVREQPVPARRRASCAASRYGVCTGIVPWNFPFLMAGWKIGPAIAAGNCARAEAGELHVAHRGRDGEVVRGGRHPARRRQPHHRSRRHRRRGARAAPARRQGRVHRLHRGRPPHHAARVGHREEGDARARRQVRQHRARRRRPRPRGRRRAVGHVLPQRPGVRVGHACPRAAQIYDEFVGMLVERAGKIVIGDNMDMNTDLGPLVAPSQVDTIERYVKLGLDEGAKLLCGGSKPDGPGRRARPSRVLPADDLRGRQLDEDRPGGDLRPGAVRDPVRLRRRGDQDRERLDLRPRRRRVVEEPRPGALGRRRHAHRHRVDQRLPHDHAEQPFGGYKQSGIGRELGDYGYNEYRQIKHVQPTPAATATATSTSPR